MSIGAASDFLTLNYVELEVEARRSIEDLWTYSSGNGCRGPARLSALALADRLGNVAVSWCALCPVLTILIPNVTDPPHNFIDSFTVTIHHVSDASYNHSFKFLTFPSYLSSSAQVLPKADQEGPSRPSACLPVAGLRL